MRTVSVVISTFNRSTLLREAIDSVLAQTYPAIEIIVTDDCSTDDTAAVVATYGSRVRYIRTERNSGQAVTRNTGLRAATGDYLCFLDDDDAFLPAKIEKQVRLLDARPDAGFALCRYYHTDEHGHRLQRSALMPEGALLKQLVQGCFISTISIPLVRRECMQRIGELDATLPTSTDFDLWLRISRAGFHAVAVQEVLTTYRLHLNNLTRDASRLERGGTANLDKLFANPDLPDDVVAVKDQAYANMRVWISSLYYNAGQWEGGIRNLAAACALDSGLRGAKEFCDRLVYMALDARMSDPVRFTTGVLEHLPAPLSVAPVLRNRTMAWVHFGVALRAYRDGAINDAQQHVQAAIKLDPSIFKSSRELRIFMVFFAMTLAVASPVKFTKEVLHNLPAQAQVSLVTRQRLLSRVYAACAWEAHVAHDSAEASRQAANAVRHDPTVLRNRDVSALFVRSLTSRRSDSARPMTQRAA